MSVTRDIVRSYRTPRRVMRDHIARGAREDRALIFVMAACALIFIAQWPRLSREAHLAPEIPLDARLGGALMAWLIIMPLVLYMIAGVTQALSHLIRRPVEGIHTRIALFWALLAASPLWLFHGLVAGFIGPGPAQEGVGVLALLAFASIWAMSLVEAATGGAPDGAATKS